MQIWYEIEDALDSCVDSIEKRLHAECRYEVWEWCSLESGSEAGLLGRFRTRHMAHLFIQEMKKQVAASGRGGLYPKDPHQKALERLHALDDQDSTIH